MASKRGVKRRLKQRGCEGKKKRDKKNAKEHIDNLWLKDKEKMNMYKCKFCGFWHVGHKNGR